MNFWKEFNVLEAVNALSNHSLLNLCWKMTGPQHVTHKVICWLKCIACNLSIFLIWSIHYDWGLLPHSGISKKSDDFEIDILAETR